MIPLLLPVRCRAGVGCCAVTWRGFATPHKRFDEALQLRAQRCIILIAQVATQLHRYVVFSKGRARTECFPYEPLASIAVDCSRCSFAACDDSQSRLLCSIGACAHDEVRARYAQPGSQNSFEFAGLAQHAGPCKDPRLRQTASRARPLALRALITARPALVFMRTRNPCVRLRRVLEGWYVRFMSTTLAQTEKPGITSRMLLRCQ
ncbi:MAG: hypothetical protein V7640_515 [Betaproteobacteria bacterium]